MNWSDYAFGFVSGAFAALCTLSFAAWRMMHQQMKAQGLTKWRNGVTK